MNKEKLIAKFKQKVLAAEQERSKLFRQRTDLDKQIEAANEKVYAWNDALTLLEGAE